MQYNHLLYYLIVGTNVNNLAMKFYIVSKIIYKYFILFYFIISLVIVSKCFFLYIITTF